jgi:hypothetical protein
MHVEVGDRITLRLERLPAGGTVVRDVWFMPGHMPDMFDELDSTRSLHPPMSETRR